MDLAGRSEVVVVVVEGVVVDSVVVVLGDFVGTKASPKSSFSTDSFQDKSGS